ncbi:hypothetical protein L1D14_04265 [Vibrio tubiashii]|uniref:hypothetical protein n=1 Tax=Vibrio tubiashii TaxID=29498 RepID=UPI001EFCCF66|nr:hypothetical protein [Vibrio tubiashii]MCG9575446.1 hypothetical protein [Vibrio tubiashii]
MFNSISEPVVISLIQGCCTIIAALLPSAVLLWVSRGFLRTKQTERTCLNALEELEVCKAVESCLSNNPNLSLRQAKAHVAKEQGLRSRDLFTPSKLNAKLHTYRRKVDAAPPLL